MLVAIAIVFVAAVTASAKECHPMDPDNPKPGDLYNCHRDCNWFTEWCVPDNSSTTGWACGPKHKRGEAQPGQSCVPGGGTVFCSNCPAGYFCQHDGPPSGYECDVLMQESVKPHALTQMKADSDNGLCSPCVQLGGQSLNILLNYVLNAGVIGGCSKICGNLKSKGAREVCDVACGIVGIKAFIKALNHTDLDPIYFCELIHACSAGPDNATMELLSVAAEPSSIAKGDTVQLSVQLNVTSASGVGEFGISVDGPVTQPVSQRFLLPQGIPMGMQHLAVKLAVHDDASGDFPVIWQPGSYSYTFEVCQGECHSKHPHSKYFGSKRSNFTLTDTAEPISI